MTVYSRRRGVDPNYAPEVVLRAIPGLDDAAIEAILEQRNGPRAAVNSRRGVYFNRTASRSFTIRSEAEMPDGGRFLRHAVIEMTGSRGAYRVHLWQAGETYDEATTQ